MWLALFFFKNSFYFCKCELLMLHVQQMTSFSFCSVNGWRLVNYTDCHLHQPFRKTRDKCHLHHGLGCSFSTKICFDKPSPVIYQVFLNKTRKFKDIFMSKQAQISLIKILCSDILPEKAAGMTLGICFLAQLFTFVQFWRLNFQTASQRFMTSRRFSWISTPHGDQMFSRDAKLMWKTTNLLSEVLFSAAAPSEVDDTDGWYQDGQTKQNGHDHSMWPFVLSARLVANRDLWRGLSCKAARSGG